MKKVYIAIIFMGMVLGMVLAGCGGLSYDEKVQAQFWATQYAENGVIPPPKYQTLAATALNLRLAATPQPVNLNPGTPTMSFYDYSGTQAAQVQNNAMTAQVQQQQYEMDKLKAEQAAEQARQAAQAHSDQMTSQAQAQALQATSAAEGTRVANTAIAQATATERAFVMSNNATGTAYIETAIVRPTSDVLTMQAVRIQQTVEAGEAEKVELAVKREKATNYFKAFLPYLVIVGLTFVFGRGFSTYVKTRVHARDEHGRKPTITRELADGGVITLNPDQMETGIVKITGTGEVVRYAPMDKEEQSHINKGNIIAEIVGQLPQSQSEAGKNLLTNFAGRQTQAPPRIVVTGDGALRTAIEEADQKLIEENL